jgi:hypothetical protein
LHSSHFKDTAGKKKWREWSEGNTALSDRRHRTACGKTLKTEKE